MFAKVISNLRLIEVSKIRFHEKVEVNRLDKLINNLEEYKFLKNPPLAVELSDETYLIIDGAHRVSALIKMGSLRIPIQIVDLSQLNLDFWRHEIPKGSWIKKVKEDKRISLRETGVSNNLICDISFVDGNKISLYSISADKYLEAWNFIVSSYSTEYPVNRIANSTKLLLTEENVIITFNPISLEDISKIVLSGKLLPAGVTRFNVKGRLLNLNIPLFFLFNKNIDLYEWNNLYENWNRSLRYYENSVFINE